MGVCHQIILLDERNWKYENYSKKVAIDALRNKGFYLTYFHGGLIVDIDKMDITEFLDFCKHANIPYDSAYKIADNAMDEIMEVI